MILLMVQKSGDHQLRLVVYPIVYRILCIPSGCLGFLNHQQYQISSNAFLLATQLTSNSSFASSPAAPASLETTILIGGGNNFHKP